MDPIRQSIIGNAAVEKDSYPVNIINPKKPIIIPMIWLKFIFWLKNVIPINKTNIGVTPFRTAVAEAFNMTAASA